MREFCYGSVPCLVGCLSCKREVPDLVRRGIVCQLCLDHVQQVRCFARTQLLGAEDFLPKDVPAKAYAAAIKRAVRGEAPPADAPMSQMKAKLQVRPDPKADDVPLTRREYQVLLHVAYGLSNREIGYSLSISIETVKEHIQNILRKFDMPDRTAAAVWAVKRGLV